MPVSAVSPDEHGDRQHVVGHRQHARRPTRARVDEDEAAQVGARLGRRGDVLLAREAADLDERARDELAQLRGRVGGPHQRRSDEHGVGAGELRLRAVRARVDRALRDHDAVARRAGDELELRAAVDRERGQVAGVDADRIGAERDGARELVRVVRLDERVETERARVLHAAPPPAGRRGRAGAGARRRRPPPSARRARASVVKNPLASSGRRGGCSRARRSSTVPAKRSSTRIDTAAAPARSNAAASAAGSASGRRSPADGERRLTSAIAANPARQRSEPPH